MHRALFVCYEPPRYIGPQRLLIVVECRGTGFGSVGGPAAVLQLTIRPVALIFLERARGRVLMATGLTLARLEQLLLEEAREALDV